MNGKLKTGLFVLSLLFTVLHFEFPLAAKPPERTLVDLPAPYDVQIITLNRGVSLNWKWQAPEVVPEFIDFGYDVQRGDGKMQTVSGLTASDLDLDFGTYTYRVRARGGARSARGRIEHQSHWSEPVQATIQVACAQAPMISLEAQPTKRSYAAVPSLRLHLTGRVEAPKGCTLRQTRYHIDSGTGINRTGPLPLDAQGRFDDFVDALGPDDEMPAGGADFTITATAEDEAGPVTSNAYTIHMELRNPYAPRDPE